MPQRTPKPYDAALVHKFWTQEPWDDLLPEPGFLTDFVLANRGIETPTNFAIWAGIFAVATALKREAWVRWMPKLFPNLYIILVAPPRLSPKSAIINRAAKLLRNYPEVLPDARLQFVKRIKLILGRATPESLTLAMEASESERWYNEAGHDYERVRGAEIVLMISELENFLGRQKYNVGLIGRLMDLYDCKDYDTDNTIARGAKEFHDVYCSILGGTTRDGLSEAVPSEAFGSGFMSRLIIVYQYKPTRIYPYPTDQLPELPPADDLERRLAWVAMNAQGEYILEPKADEYYRAWYYRFKEKILSESEFERKTAKWSRLDIHLIKLALVLRAQRYEPGNVISLADIELANKYLDRTYNENEHAIEDVGATPHRKSYNHLRDYLLSSPERTRTRTQVQQRMSRYGVDKEELRRLILEMREEGLLTIKLNDTVRTEPSANGKETYTWHDPSN